MTGRARVNVVAAFCEPVTAGSNTLIHIRPLTSVGLKLGGGADTPALCGRRVDWDLEAPITPRSIEDPRTCSKCRDEFERLAAL